MISYFISPAEHSDRWSVDPVQLRAQISAHWPEARFAAELLDETRHAIEWQLQMSEGPVEGALNRKGRGVILRGDVCDCATVAAWFRTTVPDWQELLFYDDGYNVHVSLRPGITAEEVARPFLDPPPV
ncbi:MAG TPA: hypothetical protein VKZ18_29300 [Polyangia bacterium]|nr:hypothetical protein [Polyangia bacterium]